MSDRHDVIGLQTWPLRLRLLSKAKYAFNVLVRVRVCSPNNIKVNARTVNKFISTIDTADLPSSQFLFPRLNNTPQSV
jgi:hypothetical protein